MCGMTRVSFLGLLSIAFVLCGCVKQAEYPDELQAVDGVLYLKVRKIGFPIFGIASASNPNGALYRSRDRGRTWQVISQEGWSALAPVEATRVYLAKGNSLYEMRDGETMTRPVHEFAHPIQSISRAGGGLLVLTQSAILLSGDNGATWKELDHPEFGLNAPTHAVAGDGSRLAMASDFGRVWIRDAEQHWSEAIVGPVIDLASLDGAFFALTTMSTLAVVEGGSVRHIALEPDWTRGYGSRFSQVQDRLFFNVGQTLYEVVGREAVARATLPPSSAGPGLFAMVDDEMAVRATTDPSGGVRLFAIDLRESGRVELGLLPAY